MGLAFLPQAGEFLLQLCLLLTYILQLAVFLLQFLLLLGQGGVFLFYLCSPLLEFFLTDGGIAFG